MQWTQAEFTITDQWDRLDVDAVHRFLHDSYWAKGISKSIVEKALRNSVCFGLFDGAAQIGFARAVTDRATFAYLADVFVLPSHRGRGLAKWLVSCVLAHPELQGFRRWMLATVDAHGLYRKLGFTPLTNTDRYMEIHDPNVYLRGCP